MATKKISIDVLGMNCAACSSRVEKVLLKQEGVISANVNLLANKANIEYDANKIKLEDLMKIIEKTGFKAKIGFKKDLSRDKELREKEIKSLKTSFIISAILSIPLFSAMFLHMAGIDNILNNGWFQLALATPVQDRKSVV